MMSAEILADRLSALGIRARVEWHDGQLVVVPLESVPDLADPVLRAAVVELARTAGSSHVSLEILGDGEDATLHRNHPA